MKILLLGGTGMLGGDCIKVFEKEHDVIAPDKKDLDIISWDQVIENMNKISPDAVVNCAAFTDVDECEGDDYMVEKVNVEGPRNLAQGAARFDCKLVHISTDYVYSGMKSIPQPYFEDDPPDPLSEYGKQKMHSETAIRENASNYFIVRSGWLYGLNGDHFITGVLRNTVARRRKTIKVVDDQFGSPTWTYRLAQQINELMKVDAKGTYHATSEGYCNRYEYAQYVFHAMKLKIRVDACSMRDFPAKARRPMNCILENRLLKKQGINIMPEWQADLDLFLDEFGEEVKKRAKSKK